MLTSANIVKISQLSAHHGPEKRTDTRIFELIYAPSTILTSDYISVYMRVFHYYLSVINNYLSLINSYLSVIINYQA